MWAMIVKEVRQVRRDRRTLAMMIVMPIMLLVVFGYAASFDVTRIEVAFPRSWSRWRPPAPTPPKFSDMAMPMWW